MPVTIEEGSIDGLAATPTFTKVERDATINQDERNRIQNLREQKLMDMLEHICVEVSNMSKAIQNLNLAQQPKPNFQPRSDLEERLSSLELRVASIAAATVAMPIWPPKGAMPIWPPKGHPAPPTPTYDPNYRRPRISDTDPYDPANYNTGFTGFGK